MNPYASLLIMTALALPVAVGDLAMNAIIGPTRRNRVEVVSYECDIDSTPTNAEHGYFPVSFYLMDTTFIIFDIRVVFLYPWATTFGRLSSLGLGVAIPPIGLITAPYILEWCRDRLDWG